MSLSKSLFISLSLLTMIILLTGFKKEQNNGEVTSPEKPVVDYTLWEIKNGKFYLDGTWRFLKIAKPLRNFAQEEAVNKLISDLDILKEKKCHAMAFIDCLFITI